MPDPANPSPAPNPDPNPAPPPEPGADPAPAPAAMERPEGLPDDFWDVEKAQVKFGDLTQRLNDLTAREAEFDSHRAKAPEKPDGYKVELPKEFEVPEGMDFKPDAENPLTKPVMDWAHKHGLSQAAFSELVAIQARTQIEGMQADKEFYDKEDAEKLGEQAAQRRKAAAQWVGAKFTGDKQEAGKFVRDLLHDPLAVLAIEHVMGLTAGPTTKRSGAEDPGKDKDISSLSWEEKQARASARVRQLAGL